MPYSFTEKKRIRKDFSRLADPMEFPNLLAIQLESYSAFLQADVAPEERGETGLHAAFKSIFPLINSGETAVLEYVNYTLDAPAFDVRECVLRGMTYAVGLHVTFRLLLYDRESRERRIKEVKQQDVYLGEIPMMTENGTFIVNGTERVVVSQMHRSPGVFFDDSQRHSSGRVIYRARIIPYRGSWLDFEFGYESKEQKEFLYVRIDRRKKIPVTQLLRAIGLSDEEILNEFYEIDRFHLKRDGSVTLELNPDHMVGENALFPIKGADDEVLVSKDERITQRHARMMHPLRRKRVEVPEEYLLGRTLGKTVQAKHKYKAGTVITSDVWNALIKSGTTKFRAVAVDGTDLERALSYNTREERLTVNKVSQRAEKGLRLSDPESLDAVREGGEFRWRSYYS